MAIVTLYRKIKAYCTRVKLYVVKTYVSYRDWFSSLLPVQQRFIQYVAVIKFGFILLGLSLLGYFIYLLQSKP